MRPESGYTTDDDNKKQTGEGESANEGSRGSGETGRVACVAWQRRGATTDHGRSLPPQRKNPT